jgi:hypothetical protein
LFVPSNKVVNVSRFVSSVKYQIFGWTCGVLCICYYLRNVIETEDN